MVIVELITFNYCTCSFSIYFNNSIVLSSLFIKLVIVVFGIFVWMIDMLRHQTI